MTIPAFEPTIITMGETVKWRRSFLEYDPADGWVLKYYFRGSGTGIDVTASANGSEFVSEITAVQSAAFSEGIYYWQAEASKGGEKYIVDSGQTRVKRSLSAVPVNEVVDNRSENEKILAAIDALMAKKATLDQKRYQIGNRALERYSIEELIKMREHYARLVAQERQARKMREGGDYFKTILVRTN
jgi:hypothetical protein